MATSPTRKTQTRMIAALAVLVLAVAPAAFAAKGGGGGRNAAGGSSALTVTPGGPYAFGDQIVVTTNVSSDLNPVVSLSCSQGGQVVATGVASAGGGAVFNLGPTQSWGMGAADCTVSVSHLNGGKSVTDASTSFHVDA